MKNISVFETFGFLTTYFQKLADYTLKMFPVQNLFHVAIKIFKNFLFFQLTDRIASYKE